MNQEFSKNRKQATGFHHVRSRIQSVNVRFGVPQGSILGPMLFNLYVSDLQDHLPSSIGSIQYADDTTIYRTYSNKRPTSN